MDDKTFRDHEPEREPEHEPKANVPAETGRMVNPYAVFRQRNSSGGGLFRGDTIKCDHQNGEWGRVRGQTTTLIDIKKERFIVNPPEMIDTWTKFSKGKPVDGSRKVYRTSEFEFALPREDLGDLDEERWEWDRNGKKRKDPWQRMVLLPMRVLSDNEVVVFKATGAAAIEEIGELVGMYASADRGGKLPVIEPCTRNFKSGYNSTVHVPVFKLVDWMFWEADVAAPPIPQRPASAVALPAPAAKPAAPVAKPKPRNNDMDDDIPFVLAFVIASAVAWLSAGSTLIA